MAARLTDRDRMFRAVTETAFQQQVINLAHLFGWRVAHFRTVRIQRRGGSVYYATPVAADGEGFPDLILVRENRLIAAELKQETGRLETAQQEWLAAFEGTCAEVFIWRPSDIDAIEECLR